MESRQTNEENNKFKLCAHSLFTVLHMFIYCRHETVLAKLITLHMYKLIPQVWFQTLHVNTQFT